MPAGRGPTYRTGPGALSALKPPVEPSALEHEGEVGGRSAVQPIGEPTQGVFSDTLDRVLPNGMAVWLPNGEFLTRSGRTFGGAGVPPHMRTPVFTEEEFAKNRDSAFDAAGAALRR